MTWRQEVNCTRKRDYPSYKAAKTALDQLRTDKPDDEKVALLNVYKCPVREHFHIGHATAPDRVRQLQKRAARRAAKAAE